MFNLETVANLVAHYGYFLLLLICIFEGPIITVIASFLASTGILNIVIVYGIAVMGDIIGDIIYYWIGRAGRRNIIPKYGRYIGVTEERIRYAEAHYQKHFWKTMIVGKVTQAPINVLLVLAGVTKTDFKKFITMVIATTLPKVLVFVFVGFYLGKSYKLIGHYFDNYVLAMSVVITVLLAIHWLWRKNQEPI